MNKKSMRIYQPVIFSALMFSALVFAGAGCTNKEVPAAPEASAAQENSAPRPERNFDNFPGDEISIEDLSVGDQVFVMGQSSDDGSISARLIQTGDLPEPGDFGRFGNPQSGDNQDGQAPQNAEGQQQAGQPGGFNRGEFANLSPDERQARFQQMRDNGELPDPPPGGFGGRQGFGGRNGAGGFETIRGEILSIDDLGLTIKLEESGSKLVVVSDETRIVRVERPADSEDVQE